MSTIWLRMRLAFCITLLFAIIYAMLIAIMHVTGFGTPMLFGIIAFFIVFIQYIIGPKIVEKTMKIRYVTESEEPRLHALVTELATQANIPKPKVGISQLPIANAFAFGKSKNNSRVCVTAELLRKLNEKELKAVIGHEISHIKHRDVITITMLSVIPMICYLIYISFFWSSLFQRRRDSNLSGIAIALIAFITYFITNLLVLYASRIREYYADQGSVGLTNDAPALASALYRISYLDAKVDRKTLKSVEGMKAFFASDPSTAKRDVTELRQADLNRDGRLDLYEVKEFTEKAKVPTIDRIMELFSSHPNMVKRVKRLYKLIS